VAKARDIPGLSAEGSYAAAAAKIVEVRSQELADHAAGVLDIGDIERVHDMRVASRRLRAALEVFEPCFPRKRFRAALDDVKAVADALGERRDRDVAIDALEQFAAALPAPDRPGVASLVAQLREEQSSANEALGPFVSRERLEGLTEQLTGLAAEARRKAPQ
jgi:CHAD domain-containing protein